MAGPHDWDWASPTTATTSVSSPVSSSGGGHPGGWAHEPSQTFSTPPQPDPPAVVVNNAPPGELGGQGYVAPTPAIDVAAEQDAADDALAISLANQDEIDQGQDTNIPSDPYVPDWGENMVNISQVGGGVNTPGSLLYGIDLETYFGEGANNLEFLPQEFLQMLGQGVVVGGSDAVANDALGPGFSGAPENDAEQQAWNESVASGWDPNVGTWGQVEGQWNFGDPYGLLEDSMTPENYEAYLWNFDPNNPNQIVPDESLSHPYFTGGQESFYDMMDENWGTPNAPGGGGGGGWEDYDDYYGDRRQAKMDLLTALQSGAPAKGLEQSGFFNELVPQYHPDEASKVLEKGIFSGMMPGYTGEGMKRLLRSYGSGLQAPRYANVAKGGIVGLLGV